LDIERLVELATKAICERLNSGGVKVAAFGDIPEGLISGAEIKAGKSRADADTCDYVVMSIASFHEMLGGKQAAAPASVECPAGNVVDLCGKRLIHERDLRDRNIMRGDLVKVSGNAIITALAHDFAKSIGAKIQKE